MNTCTWWSHLHFQQGISRSSRAFLGNMDTSNSSQITVGSRCPMHYTFWLEKIKQGTIAAITECDLHARLSLPKFGDETRSLRLTRSPLSHLDNYGIHQPRVYRNSYHLCYYLTDQRRRLHVFFLCFFCPSVSWWEHEHLGMENDKESLKQGVYQ